MSSQLISLNREPMSLAHKLVGREPKSEICENWISIKI